jgi:uncharacterized protein YjiK
MKLLIKNRANIILLLSFTLIIYKCNTNRQQSPILQNLLQLKSTPLLVPEPSGLALSYDGKFFWAVSDDKSLIYKIDKNGKILAKLRVNGEDLEGITVINSNSLAIILERTREVVVVDTLGNEITRNKINVKGKLNEGLEGICYDVFENNFYFVNEKKPGLLIKTDANFNEIFRKEIKFARDYSEIFFAKEDSTLWILSDESEKIIQTDRNGKKLKEYGIKVIQPEGLIVDYKNKIVYVVSDKTEKLYEFKLP